MKYGFIRDQHRPLAGGAREVSPQAPNQARTVQVLVGCLADHVGEHTQELECAHYARSLRCPVSRRHGDQGNSENETRYKVWMCIVCGWIYNEAAGAPEEGLAPGSRWEDVPDDWACPGCGAGKDDFELIEL